MYKGSAPTTAMMRPWFETLSGGIRAEDHYARVVTAQATPWRHCDQASRPISVAGCKSMLGLPTEHRSIVRKVSDTRAHLHLLVCWYWLVLIFSE